MSLLIAGILLALLLIGSDPDQTLAEINRASAWRLAAVVSLNVPMAFLFGFRSNLVLTRAGYRLKAGVLFPLAILGNVAGSFTPAASGEALRATALRTHSGMRLGDALSVILYERGLSIYLLVLLTALVGAALLLPAGVAVAAGIAALPLFLVPLFAGNLLRLALSLSGEDRPGAIGRFVRRLASGSELLQALLQDRRLTMRWYSATVLVFLLITLQLWLLAEATSSSHEIDPAEAWFALGASQLVGIASLLPFGLGSSDGSLAAILHQSGLNLDQGAAVAILLRATMTIPLGLAAVGSYLLLLRKPAVASDVTSPKTRADLLENPGIGLGVEMKQRITPLSSEADRRVTSLPAGYHAGVETADQTDYEELWAAHWGKLQDIGPVHRHERRIILETVKRLPIRSVLDVGCGNGSILKDLQDALTLEDVAGVDISAAAIEIAKRRVRGQFLAQDILDGNPFSRQFDLVLSSQVIEHIPDDDAFLDRIYDLTSDYALIGTMQGRMRPSEVHIGHYRNYTRAGLQAKLRRAGFEVEKVIEWGFPFYSPLFRTAYELVGGERRSAASATGSSLVASLLYQLYRLNSSTHGDVLMILARKRQASGPA